jgi:3-oxoacyl-[acyl-carrier-protein] synthase II
MNPSRQPCSEAVRRRVVITGMGVIAPNGQDLDTFWRSVRDGVSAAGWVTKFDTSPFPNRVAAEVKEFDASRYMDPKFAKRLDLSIQYGIAAAKLAMQDASLNPDDFDAERIGIVEATSISGLESTLKSHRAFLSKGYRGISPFTFVNSYCGGGSGEIARELGIKGHAITYCSGSCSGNDAIGYALRMIQMDEVDAMVAGGADAPLMEAFWGGFCVARIMTRRNTEPQRAMRPYDRSRDGVLLGEGGAFVVLEELTHALLRKARIYAEVMGHGRSCEAYDSVAPHPEGIGLSRAMQKALHDAHVTPEDIDYINPHGTATAEHDLVEVQAIKRAFGASAYRVAVSATKPVTGHLLGAAGALETVVCALAVHHRVIPPTINLLQPAEGCDLDFVPSLARPYPLRRVMNLNTGFGGKNSCLILGAPPEGS